ncbi:acetylcholinesterase-like [Asterias rubens]|uniref:acetylcholinesterase-like n=1 Tax=Asterias rubens TaxID=7604 RepID=UPI001455C723|nr:acetylcholinesterase-like [Asterias rubens]XP_033637446.1 acetylcholinesterase-like [Asterias rubens]
MSICKTVIMNSEISFALVVGFLSFVASQDAGTNGPIERISTGQILGKRMDVLGKTVDAFLGVPYGKAPVGDLRFKSPQPREPWDGTYNATTHGFGCFQVPDESYPGFPGSEMWNPNVRLEEDCLNLNVWVPYPRPINSSVLLWIFGGSFITGVDSLDVYDGKTLAAEEGIIVVSMNYRLGPLGFLAMDDSSAPGNMGLRDQALSMQWVQDNIHVFGGNPKEVTLFGESAGAASIGLHMVSPESMHLFKRAALESASATVPWGYDTMEEGMERGMLLADALQCTEDTNGVTLSTSQVIDCLRNRDVVEILTYQWVTSDYLDFPFVPVIDGTFLTERPESALSRGAVKDCEMLIGSNTNEGTFFLIYEVPGFSKDTESLLSKEGFVDALKYAFSQANSFGLNALMFEYTPWLSPDDGALLRDAIDMATGDYNFICPTYEMAVGYARASKPVYYYRFTERASNNPWPEWMGVLHADEIAYIFGLPLHPENGFNEEEKRLSRMMMGYWANFARTGNPNGAFPADTEGSWPLYTAEGQEYFTLDKSIVDGDTIVGRGPFAQRCAFWRQYFPTLITQTGDISEAERKWKQQFDDWSTKYMVNWKAEFDKYVNGNQCGDD